MNKSKGDDFTAAFDEGAMAADRTTARSLKRCGPLARAVWAALASVRRHSLPVAAIVERFENREEEVRAALVELTAFRLIGYDVDGTTASYAGIWLDEVSKVLGGEHGSVLYPNWDMDPKWVLVSTSEWL